MFLVINGEKHEFTEEAWNISRVLEKINVHRPETVAVQVNGEFVANEAYESTRLNDNDQVEFLYFMGGGK
jgi:sulfur carrier protein